MIDSKSVKKGSEVERKIKKNDMVFVEGTGSSKFIPKGKKKKVHRILAEKLVENGSVTLKGEAPSSKLRSRKE
jgi:hypothetical protein